MKDLILIVMVAVFSVMVVLFGMGEIGRQDHFPYITIGIDETAEVAKVLPQVETIDVYVERDGVPVPNQIVSVYYGDQLVTSGRTDTEYGHAMLVVTDLDNRYPGRIEIISEAGSPRFQNISFDAQGYNKIYYFNLGTTILADEKSQLSTPTRGAGNAGKQPTKTPQPQPTSTPSPTVVPFRMIERFEEGNQEDWLGLGPVDSKNDHFMGNVEIADDVLQFNLFMFDPYWVHHVGVPTEKPLKDLVVQVDVDLVREPKNDGVCRFHVHLRRQPDHSYYSVALDHTNVVTIYYVYRDEDGVHYQNLHHFHASGFKTGAGETNTLKIDLKENVFKIQVNEGEIREFVDQFRFINQPGQIQLGVDGPEETLIQYEIDDLMIREWTE